MKLRVAIKVMSTDWTSYRKDTVTRARRRVRRWRSRNPLSWEMLIYGSGLSMKQFRKARDTQ